MEASLDLSIWCHTHIWEVIHEHVPTPLLTHLWGFGIGPWPKAKIRKLTRWCIMVKTYMQLFRDPPCDHENHHDLPQRRCHSTLLSIDWLFSIFYFYHTLAWFEGESWFEKEKSRHCPVKQSLFLSLHDHPQLKILPVTEMFPFDKYPRFQVLR